MSSSRSRSGALRERTNVGTENPSDASTTRKSQRAVNRQESRQRKEEDASSETVAVDESSAVAERPSETGMAETDVNVPSAGTKRSRSSSKKSTGTRGKTARKTAQSDVADSSGSARRRSRRSKVSEEEEQGVSEEEEEEAEKGSNKTEAGGASAVAGSSEQGKRTEPWTREEVRAEWARRRAAMVDSSVPLEAVERASHLSRENEASVLEMSEELVALDETARSREDPLLFSAYAGEVMSHLKELEVAYDIIPNYWETVQEEVDEGMRAILVDWLVEVVEEYRLMPETLYISVQLVDRYLSRTLVTRADLQLVGIACIVLAGKMEEIWIPPIDDFIAISDNTYSRERIVAMEATVAATLDFRLKTATSKTFMHRFLRAGGAVRGDNQTALVKYLCELTLQEARFLNYRPSLICAAAQYVSRRLSDITPIWTPTLEHVTGYSSADLRVCADDICRAHREAHNLVVRAIYEKYSHSPYNRVSTTIDPIPPSPEDLDEEGNEPLASSARNLTANTY